MGIDNTARTGSEFDQKVALVTGAGSGIGAATAKAFAAQGARVCCVDLNIAAAGEVAQSISASGGEAIACGVDVSDEAGNADMVAQCLEAFGALDIAFLNAGMLAVGPILETTVASWDKVMGVNTRGVFLGMRAVVPALRKSGGGVITTTASVAGLIGDAGMALYTASKHAVVGLTKCAAGEYAHENIRVNAIAPGAVATPMAGAGQVDLAPGSSVANLHPMGRVADPAEVADLVLFLSSDRASFITGTVQSIDGGIMAVNHSSYRGES